MSTVPHLDLRRQHAALADELARSWQAVLADCAFVGGPAVAEWESAWAHACSVRHAVGVGSGTDALRLALAAVGVGRDDEVVVPAFTFVATAGAVMELGARPILVDVDPASALIDPARVAEALTPRTRAVLPVHLHGLVADPRPLREAFEGRDIAIVEDAAQAHGATLDGRPVGSLADAAAFSFYPTKNLGACGDAGAVTCDDDAIAERVRVLADHGRPVDPSARDRHDVPGVNSRLSGLQAATLLVKLPHLSRWNARRREVVGRYVEALGGRDDVSVITTPNACEPAWHLFAVRHRRREALRAALAERGIASRPTYPRALHEYGALRGHVPEGARFPEAEAWAREVLTLPLFPEITDEEVDRVIAALPDALDEARSER